MLSRKQVRYYIEHTVERILRTLFFWTKTEQQFGEALVMLHIALKWLFIFAMILTAVSNTIPLLLYVILVLSILLLLQHYILGICILSSIEKRVIGHPYPLLWPIFYLFDIPNTPETTRGIMLLLLSSLVTVFALLMIVRK